MPPNCVTIFSLTPYGIYIFINTLGYLWKYNDTIWGIYIFINDLRQWWKYSFIIWGYLKLNNIFDGDMKHFMARIAGEGYDYLILAFVNETKSKFIHYKCPRTFMNNNCPCNRTFIFHKCPITSVSPLTVGGDL